MSLIMEGFLEEIIFKLAFGKKKSRAWQTNPNSRGITQRKKKDCFKRKKVTSQKTNYKKK